MPFDLPPPYEEHGGARPKSGVHRSTFWGLAVAISFSNLVTSTICSRPTYASAVNQCHGQDSVYGPSNTSHRRIQAIKPNFASYSYHASECGKEEDQVRRDQYVPGRTRMPTASLILEYSDEDEQFRQVE